MKVLVTGCALGSVPPLFVFFFLAVQREVSDPLPLPIATTKSAVLTFDELRAGIRQHYTALWALEVEYEQFTVGGEIPSMNYHFAFKGEKRFRKQTDVEGRVYGLAYDGGVLQVYQPEFSAAMVVIRKDKDRFADVDAYVDALGIPISDFDRANASWLPKLMPYALDAPQLQWTVHPTLDVVDGAECHVLVSSDRQRIWVDPAIGFAMRFREQYEPVKNLPEHEWPLLVRYFYSQFERTAAGVHLPSKNEIVAYHSSSSPRSVWNQPKFYTVHNVRRLAVGREVHDDLFSFELPPGTEVLDEVRDRFYRVGAFGEELDRLVGQGREELAQSRFEGRIWILLVNATVVMLLALLCGYRLLRSHRRAKAP